ncbi:MAG: CRISPR-associated helicase Cas3' [Clostridiales bacterium]|jgi:CRISPR-associated endonuclease/helicase Cas3|nr:CRISPR-associated helicase Cas3' [Eubacteriales bacterium]MDH7565868.1 CRISPR-associated helicase Cas3' [Clostridiales bacterium]
MFKIGLLVRFLFSCLIDADRLNTAIFEFPDQESIRNQGNYVPWSVLIEKLNGEISKFRNQNKVDVLRQEISEQCLIFSKKPKGLYQLTVPTGGGKTLSSLRFALNHADRYHMDRIIYVIPYTSIIDQNAQKVREILEEKTNEGFYSSRIVLEHHSNLTPEEENTRQKLLSENWDAPVVFTTMVQFLETLFGYGTRSARRMHQLANAVLIFDEIQTLPVRCVHLFNLAIRFLIHACGSTVVLCTATQPLLGKIIPSQRALHITSEQQMMPDAQKLFNELKRVEVYDQCKIGGWTNLEVAGLVKKELQQTGSVLTVVNTKDSAVNLYKVLQNHPEAEVFHLSTGMYPKHRMDVLDRLRNNLTAGKPTICVSTQMIEAGVDIDFGTVIRYLAGLDSIAQAAGRCNRNGSRAGLGRVFIVNPKDENLHRLEDIRMGRDKAERVLSEYKTSPEKFDYDILGFKAIERYYQYYFYERSAKMGYPVDSHSKVGREDSLFELLSTNKYSVDAYKRQNNNSHPKIPLCQSFMTASEVFQAIDSSTRGIIVPYQKEGERIIKELCAARNLEKQYKLLREAQMYSINVYLYMLDRLLRQGIIHEVQKDTGVFYLDKQYYSVQYGICLSQENQMEFLIC